MSNASFIDSFFNQVFERVQNTLEFNPDWANGTGYLDHAAEGPDAPKLAAGEMAKSTDNFGRPMILVGTPAGNLVVFKRYSKESGVYTYNASREFDRVWMGVHCQGKQSLEDLKKFFGEWSDSENIGQRMIQKTDVKDDKINEWNTARNNLESWIQENISPEKQDELRSLIAAYSVAGAIVQQP